VKVLCPGVRQLRTGQHVCRDLLSRIPASWGPAKVQVLTSPHQCSGTADLRYCRRCGSWIEVRFIGLEAA
jgi:hypothetical protein